MTDIKDLKKGDKIRYLGRKNTHFNPSPHATLKVGDIVMFKYYNYMVDRLECEDATGAMHNIYPVTSNWEIVKEPETITLQTKEDLLGKVFRTKDEDEWDYVTRVLSNLGFLDRYGVPEYSWAIKSYKPEDLHIRVGTCGVALYIANPFKEEVYILNKPTYTAEVLQPKAPSEKEALQKKLEEHKASMKELEYQINSLKE